ncbi:MAG TPA: type II toxin-antitoxin system VapC family toxin [Lunatimonas sp.]|nr:type II toxin-antitoxin system VapC family toxin [Lunatimonas sp.]
MSNASFWEIAIKVSIGKLKLNGSLKDLKIFLIDKGFHLLEFDCVDLEMLLTLPFHHQNPFDRLIIAQSRTKAIEIITNDSQIRMYFE